MRAVLNMTHDMGFVKDKEGKVVGEKRCLHCQKRLCDCPERQEDGTWKEPNLKAELDALKEKVSIIEEKIGGN